MSTQPSGDAGHDPHAVHDHPVDGDLHDSAHEDIPQPPEPRSPSWLPLLGGALFLLGLLVFLSLQQDGEAQDSEAEAVPTEVAEPSPP